MTFRDSVLRCVIIVLLTGAACFAGAWVSGMHTPICCHGSLVFSRPPPSPADRILVLAKRAVAANDTWPDQADYLKPERNPDGTWTVLVSRRPRAPDGYRVITIGSDGKMRQYVRVQ